MLINPCHRHSFVPFLVVIILPLLMQAAALFLPLEYERHAILDGEWWRLLTGGWLHHNLSHLFLNLAALSLLWIWGVDLVPGWRLFFLLVALVAGVDLALLLFDPATQHYWGLSAALHGLFAYMSIKALSKGERSALLWGVLLIIKLWFDYHRVDHYTTQLIGTRVHTFSHLLGAVSGGLIGICCWLGNRLKRLFPAHR
jgi:rhomboid family GlyGly-CTERM serine protease